MNDSNKSKNFLAVGNTLILDFINKFFQGTRFLTRAIIVMFFCWVFGHLLVVEFLQEISPYNMMDWK
jgi:hypothetical protein